MQPELNTYQPSAEAFRQVARREFVQRRVLANAIQFRPDFPAWLEKNLPIWERFEAEANLLYANGVRQWGARTIWEYLRRQTALREADGDFKLNNNFAPALARLYLLMYPERGQFFELRRVA